MNLFFLSLTAHGIARSHCDKHVVKMILEVTQMLYTAWWINNGEPPPPPIVTITHSSSTASRSKSSSTSSSPSPAKSSSTGRTISRTRSLPAKSAKPPSAPLTGPLQPYKKTHANHPTSRWIRETANNYRFACDVAEELCAEYTRRYGKTHACKRHVTHLSAHGYPTPRPPSPVSLQQDPISTPALPTTPSKKGKKKKAPKPTTFAQVDYPSGCTPFPLAMPDECVQYLRPSTRTTTTSGSPPSTTSAPPDGLISGIESYRAYYHSKAVEWQARPKPIRMVWCRGEEDVPHWFKVPNSVKVEKEKKEEKKGGGVDKTKPRLIKKEAEDLELEDAPASLPRVLTRATTKRVAEKTIKTETSSSKRRKIDRRTTL